MDMVTTELMGTNCGYIDFHTHILPEIDDGSASAGMSEIMLTSLKNQGVDSVVLTPHYYSDREPMDRFLKRRAIAVSKIQPIAEKLKMQLYPACELYFTDYIFNYEDISNLCVNKGKYVLTEFPFSCTFSDGTIMKIERLMATLNVIPILAHIERYPPLLKNHSCRSELEGMGCLMQVNLGSFVKTGHMQRKAMIKGIKDGTIHIVGTDCHNNTTRPPQFSQGFQVICKKAGSQYADGLVKNAKKILQCK